MNRLLLIPICVIPILGSCDQKDAFGDKGEKYGLKEIKSGRLLDSAPVQDIGEVDFQAFISQPGKLNVVDFHADWCGPCKKLSPILSGVIEAHSDFARLGKLNVDNAKELAQELGVRSIPDVRFYVEGKLVGQFTGAESKERIQQLVKEHTAAFRPQLGDDGAPIPARPIAPGSKPLDEAMKPMDKDWLPPGMKPK